MEERTIRDLDELDRFAQEILARIPKRTEASVIALSGELGAGKTAFTKSLAKALGIAEQVLSPTFVLMKSYDVSAGRFRRLVHIDAYRLDNPSEFSALRFGEIEKDPRTLVAIEWPERLAENLLNDRMTLTFEQGDDDVRRVRIKPWEL
ncbi:MAG TPA: tRNA (adenosine(37)-N6)-threonylcarbamoyltransferase complex ATPase subunit type 1 TsaE [Candidatus Paceibacterota bacterium]|nr:tRNA (adenosine(37)-N6)-threonylcarbamoyltransferase complex ATPase subunit type 1 TsaE [Candidatus Paceibacterota bacterium]